MRNKYNHEVYCYNLDFLLSMPTKSWECRDNIDSADMAIKLSFLNWQSKTKELDILISFTPIFLRRSFMATYNKDTNRAGEIMRVSFIRSVVNLLWDWYENNDSHCPIKTIITLRDETRLEYPTLEDFVLDITERKLWFQTNMFEVEIDKKILGTIDLTSINNFKVCK